MRGQPGASAAKAHCAQRVERRSLDCPSSLRGRQCDCETVECRFYMRRQLGAQVVVIEVGMQVGQDRSGGFDPPNPCQRVVDTEVAWVWPVTERIHDPDFGAGQRRNAGRGHPLKSQE